MARQRATLALLPVLAASLLGTAPASAQPAPEWRNVGNTAVDLGLAGPATGPVDRVWFGPDGSRLFARTRSGLVFETSDFEHWRKSDAMTPPVASPQTVRLPELNAKTVQHPQMRNTQFAVGADLYLSEDGGANWSDLTGRNAPIGRALTDVAVSPTDPKDLVVAGSCGVWRTLDGGATWNSLNQELANLPVKRIRRTPSGSAGLQMILQGMSAGDLNADTPLLAEWAPGEKTAWRPSSNAAWKAEEDRKRSATQTLGIPIGTLSTSGETVYAGSPEGWIFVSRDGGRAWGNAFAAGVGIAVTDLWSDAKAPQTAIATLSSKNNDSVRTRVLRTDDSGVTWTDITANLPTGNVRGVSADHDTGAIYVAGDAGVFVGYNEGQGISWTSISSKLPMGAAVDVKLDGSGNQVYVAIAGQGVFAALAPHRWRNPVAVSAADQIARAAAPGSLVSILGTATSAVRSGDATLQVLNNSGQHVEIQVPFEAAGETLPLAFNGLRGIVTMGVPLQRTAPAIFTDRNGTPLLLDGDSGAFLDAATTAHPGGKVQILMTGLGRVSPDWPTGQAAPLENAPVVVAPVKAYLDRAPLEVTKATLAPGYVGFYLVEVSLPAIMNAGPAELYVEADGQASNRVRIYVEQN